MLLFSLASPLPLDSSYDQLTKDKYWEVWWHSSLEWGICLILKANIYGVISTLTIIQRAGNQGMEVRVPFYYCVLQHTLRVILHISPALEMEGTEAFVSKGGSFH